MNLIKIYIQEMIPYVVFGWILYSIIRTIIVKKKSIKIVWHKEIIISIFAAYLVGLLFQTILPLWHCGIDDLTGKFYFSVTFDNPNSHVNLIPFHTLFQYLFSVNNSVDSWKSVSKLNILANMFLYLPIGIFVPTLWGKMRSLSRILTLGLIFISTIEVVQYFVGRSMDIDDIILNTASIVVGYAVFRHFNKDVLPNL